MVFLKVPPKTHSSSFTSTSSSSSSKSSPLISHSKNHHGKRRTKVKFHDDAIPVTHHYDFDWSIESLVWYNREDLKSFNETRWKEADMLRSARGIHKSSRNLMDGMEDGDERDEFIGDKITNALDDADDEHEISLRGIEHFVYPVLQKEMVRRKKELKKCVLDYSHNKVMRRNDPEGLKLAEESSKHSKWARDVASERGIKYCQMKRGGGLLKNTRATEARRNLGGMSKASRSLKVE